MEKFQEYLQRREEWIEEQKAIEMQAGSVYEDTLFSRDPRSKILPELKKRAIENLERWIK